jgi:phosphatidate cytidylyltransferase
MSPKRAPGPGQAEEPVEELVGESRREQPATKPVSVPMLTDRTLVVRMLAGAVYVAVNLVAIWWGKLPCAVVMAFTAGVCCWEFFRLMRADAKLPNQVLGIAAAVCMPFVALVNTVYLVAVVFLLVMLLGLWYVLSQRARITDVAITAFGAIYTGMTLSALVAIRCSAALEPLGAAVLCTGVMVSVWVNDSFAYLVGSAFGRHKMVPRISPKKSWEGLAGGIAGSVLVWLALMLFPEARVDLPVALVCGVACGLTGVIGDLVESRIKRGAGVKDSGNVIPGHGGLLDRSDSMLFVAITAYFLLRILGVI